MGPVNGRKKLEKSRRFQCLLPSGHKAMISRLYRPMWEQHIPASAARKTTNHEDFLASKDYGGEMNEGKVWLMTALANDKLSSPLSVWSRLLSKMTPPKSSMALVSIAVQRQSILNSLQGVSDRAWEALCFFGWSPFLPHSELHHPSLAFNTLLAQPVQTQAFHFFFKCHQGHTLALGNCVNTGRRKAGTAVR